MIEAGNIDRAINPLSCNVPIDMVCYRRLISGKIYPPGLSSSECKDEVCLDLDRNRFMCCYGFYS